jgi:hypothetical protein
MFLELTLYFLILVIFGMVVFKILYSMYDSIKQKKSSEAIRPLSKVEGIIDGVKCPKDFFCYQSRFNSLSKTENIGLESFLVCFEEKPQVCTFAHSIDNHFFCKCPLRIYIANALTN